MQLPSEKPPLAAFACVQSTPHAQEAQRRAEASPEAAANGAVASAAEGGGEPRIDWSHIESQIEAKAGSMGHFVDEEELGTAAIFGLQGELISR